MDSKLSLFDIHNKKEKPSSTFKWKKISPGFNWDSSKVVWSGMLQEFDSSSCTIHPTRTYAATSQQLIRFRTREFTCPEAVLNLSFPRIEKFKDVAHWKYGISLEAHQITYKFATYSEEDALECFQALCRKCTVVQKKYSQHYKNLKLIGKGNCTFFHSVVHLVSGKKYSTKCIYKKALIDSSKSMERILNEIRVLKEINHPSIIELYGIYESKDCIHLVYADHLGTDLQPLLSGKTNYIEEDVSKLMKSILEALNHLHQRGVLHRDIKPSNLMLPNPKAIHEVCLINFSLATFNTDRGLKNFYPRNAGYMAPEVIQNRSYGPKIDIYSTGIILYTLLAGSSPFSGRTFQDVIEKNCIEFIIYIIMIIIFLLLYLIIIFI